MTPALFTAFAGLPAISIVSASMEILPSAKLVKSTPSTDQAPLTTVAVRTITLVVLSEIRILTVWPSSTFWTVPKNLAD